jgi:hypothetical protein
MGHLVAWQEFALAVARELAVGEESPTIARIDADWAARGDALNDELHAVWAALPMDEVRQRFARQSGELRGYLTVVPETRWWHPPTSGFLENDRHYDEHWPDLDAIVAAARGG